MDGSEWTAIFTAMLVVATVLLWKSSLRTQVSSIQLNAPILLVNDTYRGLIGNMPVMVWTFENYGNSVANNIIAEMGWDSTPEIINYSRTGRGVLIVAPRMKSEVSLPFLSAEDFEMLVRRGKLSLYLSLRLKYFGGFDKTPYEYQYLCRYNADADGYEIVSQTLKIISEAEYRAAFATSTGDPKNPNQHPEPGL